MVQLKPWCPSGRAAAVLQDVESPRTTRSSTCIEECTGMRDRLPAVLQPLLPYVHPSALPSMRLVCHAICSVIDANVRQLEWHSSSTHDRRPPPPATVFQSCISAQRILCTGAKSLCLTGISLPPRLEVLVLSSGSLGRPVDLSVLTRLSSTLRVLDISNNLLGHNGGRTLATALYSLTGLEVLDISSNQMFPESAEALAPALRRLSRLQRLNYSDNMLCQQGSTALAGAITNLSTLRDLNLAGCSLEMPLISTALAALTNLEALNLAANNLGEAGQHLLADALGNLGNLRQLDLSAEKLFGPGAAALAAKLSLLTGLQVLRLQWCALGLNQAEGGRVLLPALCTMSDLRELDLLGNVLSASGASALAPVLSQLTALEQLCISRNRLNAESISILTPALASLPTIKNLALHKNEFSQSGEALAALLAKLTSLQTLDISDCQLGSSGLRTLQPGLCQLLQLTSLDIGQNSLSPSVTTQFIGAAAKLPLRRLRLRWPELGHGNFPALSSQAEARGVELDCY